MGTRCQDCGKRSIFGIHMCNDDKYRCESCIDDKIKYANCTKDVTEDKN